MGADTINFKALFWPQTQSKAVNSLFITHFPLCLQKDGDPGRNSKLPVLSLQTAVLGCNKAVAVLP